MKREKVKSTKKTLKDDIKLSLVTELKILAKKFGEVSEKLEKEINQGAKKLAKAIAKEIKTEEPVQSETVPVAKAESVKKAKPANKVAPIKEVAPAEKAAQAKKAVNKTAKPGIKKGKPGNA